MKVVWFGILFGLPETAVFCEGYSDLSTALMNVSFGKGCMGAPLKACPEHCRMDDRWGALSRRSRHVLSIVEWMTGGGLELRSRHVLSICRMDDRIACGHPERNRALFSAVESKDRFEAG